MVLVAPDAPGGGVTEAASGSGVIGSGVVDAVDRYVAMTRATRSLTVLTR